MNFEKIIASGKMKIFILSLVVGLCMTNVLHTYSQRVMNDISSNVIRLHVIANSDSDTDQSLKLKVRDEIIKYLKPHLIDADNVTQGEEIIQNNMANIKKVAEEVVKKYGYTYGVTVDFGNYKFPTKIYENAKFPNGNYDALKIIIGEGKGQNWWCLLYPQLCFDLGNAGTLSAESESMLKGILTYDEYELVTSNKVTFKFKIVEWFSD